MFFDRVYGNLVGDNILGNMPPYATGVGKTPGQTLQNPFCTSCPQFLGFIPRTLVGRRGNCHTGATTITDAFGGNASGLLNSGDDPAMRTPKIQQYNLDVQYEFARGWVADIGYVGSHGIHLYDWNRDPNLAYLVDCGAASATCNPPTDMVNQLLERPASSFPMNDAVNANPATQVLDNTASNYLGRVASLGVNPGNSTTSQDGRKSPLQQLATAAPSHVFPRPDFSGFLHLEQASRPTSTPAKPAPALRRPATCSPAAPRPTIH